MDVDKQCVLLKERFAFIDEPLSEEEAQFPLAYGMLVNNFSVQVIALLSAIYRPQNAFCIAIDANANEQFKEDMQLLADCFPNVFVMYLSGVDVPLKTNLEMVRIFKRLNGTANAEVVTFFIEGQQPISSPLPIWKASMSALIPRETANAIVRSEKVRQFLRHLRSLRFGGCPDEALWLTFVGNPKELPIPGGIDAALLYAKMLEEVKRKENFLKKPKKQNATMKKASPEEPFHLSTYFIARHQSWPSPAPTSGMRSNVCRDIRSMLRRPEMITHKFSLLIQPAAYFCLLREVRERALAWREQRRFEGTVYAQLPLVKMARSGTNADNASDVIDGDAQLQFFFD